MDEIISILRKGGVILYPTDTVWGLGCDATNSQAVARVYAIKKRTEEKSMIVLVDKIDSVAKYAQRVPDIAWDLLENAQGGSPLTVILEGGVGVADNLLPAQKTIAIRVPEHKFCGELLRKFNRPLVSTSANISGEPSPLTFDAISPEILAAVDFIVPIEYQGSPTGKPSSIISLSQNGQIQIIRQ